MADEHQPKFWMRRRHEDEPAWLGGQWVVSCDLDNQPLYEDLEGVWVHWTPGVDPVPAGDQLVIAGG
jgi:hypothetical protein